MTLSPCGRGLRSTTDRRHAGRVQAGVVSSAKEVLLLHQLDTQNNSSNAPKATQECVKICLRKMASSTALLPSEDLLPPLVLEQTVTNQFNFLLNEGGEWRVERIGICCVPPTPRTHDITQYCDSEGARKGRENGGNGEKGGESLLFPPFSWRVSEMA